MNTEQYLQPGEFSVFEEMEQYKPVNYAGTGQRLLNLLIDTVVYYLIFTASGVVLGALQGLTGIAFADFLINQEGTVSNKLLTYLFSHIVYASAYTLIEGMSKGKTLGKLITGTRAVKEDGTDITWRDALMRSLCRLVPFETLSGLSGYPWHDKWTKTMVIKVR